MTKLDSPTKFPALVADRGQGGDVELEVRELTLADLPEGEVLIEVSYSSLNYKDALASTGHPGVVKQLPHVPGIDCAGTVVESSSDRFQPGESVLVTGYELGAPRWGGMSRYVRVPGAWPVPMPDGLDARRCMALGTAGFTAAQAVTAIVDRGIAPDAGPIVVTGATGGVGMWSIPLLAKLGYQVTAVTGKADRRDLLQRIGAAEVVGRNAVNDTSDRPLLSATWAAAVDTVGGVPLATILRSTKHRGCVAACGLVAGDELPITVHPFILRGVTLAGIDSAKCPREMRLDMWSRLAGPWRAELPEECLTECSLDEVPARVQEMLGGNIVGRTVVKLG